MTGDVGTPPAWYESLQTASGAAARLTTEHDVVAGVLPHVVVEPVHEEQLAAVLSFANSEGLKVLVCGGGTQLGTGAPPTGGDMLLSTARMTGVVEHAPGDLTATARAGTTLTDLQRHLSGAQQWLALDPVLPPNATIGGIVATNASGPRRLRYGGVRDQIIGIRMVRSDGVIAKGGGKVVKNVAGYDLPKLLTGSYGTLGVIVAATFRLYPLPPGSATVVLHSSDLASVCAVALEAQNATLTPSSVDIVTPIAGASLFILGVRYESLQEAADDQARSFVELTGSLGATARTLRGAEEANWWRQQDENQLSPGAATSIALKASVLPGDVTFWLDALHKVCNDHSVSARLRAHVAHGLIFTRLTGRDTALGACVEPLRTAASSRRGSLVVVEAPLGPTRQLDVWGAIPSLEVMRRVKAQFDPQQTLNPGRFVGGI
jgi:glycolate oxidase FAD binding subunit